MKDDFEAPPLEAYDATLMGEVWQKNKPSHGFVEISEGIEDVINYKPKPGIPYPWKGLNELTGGLHLGELTILVAETNIGKSVVVRQLIHHLKTELKMNSAAFMMEETISDTQTEMLSFTAGKRLHDYEEGVDFTPIKQKAADQFFKEDTGKVYLYDEINGQPLTLVNMIDKITYLIIEKGVQVILLDNLTMAVLETDSGTVAEYQVIGKVVRSLSKIVQQHGVAIFVVTHANQELDKDTKWVTVNSPKGARTIGICTQTMIGFNRVKDEADLQLRRQAVKDLDGKKFDHRVFQILKSRRNGRVVGRLSSVVYEFETGRIQDAEYDNEYLERMPRSNEDASGIDDDFF